MEFLIDEVCGYINNYFLDFSTGWHHAKYEIKDGTIECDFLKKGQYFKVMDSTFNEGVWKYPATDMTDEEFEGNIVPMKVPVAFLQVLKDIEEWQSKFEAVNSPNMSPFASEHFNTYGYEKGTKTNADGSVSSTPTTWRDVFGMRLLRWRKI